MIKCMNTKNLNFVMISVFFTLLLSCEKSEMENNFVIHDYRVDNVLYPKDSKLKRVYIGKDFVREYLYDDLGRIKRVSFNSADRYDIYLYNENGQLETISMYSGYFENLPALFQTITYSYDADGNKVKELSEGEHLYLGGVQTWCNIYQYNGKKLIKREYYEENQLKYYIVYEYKGNMLVMEKFYVPGENDFITTEHLYEEGLLVYSITYNGNPKSGFHRDERNYYDRNDNHIKSVENIPGLSSYSGATAFYVTWEYEYER